MEHSPRDVARKDDTITNLADILHCPVDVVEEVYHEEVRSLERIARVHEYVTLFAERRTRERIESGAYRQRRRTYR